MRRGSGRLVHGGGSPCDRAGQLDVPAVRVAFATVPSGIEAAIDPTPPRTATS